MNVQQIKDAVAKIKTAYPDTFCQETANGMLVDFKDDTMNCIFLLEADYCTLAFRKNELAKALFWKSTEFDLVLDVIFCAYNTGKNLSDVFHTLLCWYLS